MQSRREWKSAQFSSVDVPVMDSAFCFPKMRSNAFFREKMYGLRQPILGFDNRFFVKYEYGFDKKFAVFNTPLKLPLQNQLSFDGVQCKNGRTQKLRAPRAPNAPGIRAGRAHRALDFAVPQKMRRPRLPACWDRSALECCGSHGGYPAHAWNTGCRILPDSQPGTD